MITPKRIATSVLYCHSFRKMSIAGLAFACLLLNAGPGQAQVITTFAGNGNATFSGDGGPATNASLNHPTGLTIDTAGSVFIADADNWRVRKVTSGGIISTVAGSGVFGSGGDGSAAVNAAFSDLSGVVVDAAGNLYIADSGNHRVRKVTPAGVVTALAGTGVQGGSGDGGLAVNAQLNRPIGVALDAAGFLYICDSSNHNVRRVNLSTGIITTYAGNGLAAFAGDGGQATSASLMFPLGIALDKNGNLFIADAGNSAVRKVATNGVISTVAGTGNHAGFAGDGAFATAALLNLPAGVTVDGNGILFIADSGNNRVRRVDGAGIINTMAGGANDGFSGDNGPPGNALLSFPWGMAIDAAGSLYIADRANNRVRRITQAAAPPPPPPGPPAPPPSSTPKVTSLTPAAATGASQHYTLQIDDSAGAQDIDVVNILINSALDGRQACYLAYSRPTNTLYLVPDSGGGLLPGMLLNGSGSTNNSQCSVVGAGSSATTNGNTLTLGLNINFTAALAGDRVVFAAARSATLNSGWQTMGVLSVPPVPSTLPNSTGVSPSSGNTANAIISFSYQDANAATNLQTAWALINTALDGRSACYVVYYRPGNQVFLYPDNGDPAQAPSMILTGANSLSNSQCTVSAQGSSVAINGAQMTVNLNITFKPAFAGPKAIWTAVQTLGGAQTSQWRSLGAWQVPGI